MSDYLFVLENHLDPAQNRVVSEIQRIATQAGMNVWLTGGAMRDTLRGSRIVDLDFTVERDAVKAGESLAAALGGTIIEHDSLKRRVELELPGGVRASVSNARTEKYSKPGGKPQISAATIHEDLLRRDFTINAMALSLNRGSRGLLVDPTNGQADLENRELRATNPYVFFDDPSRIFRLIRFQHVLGFSIAPRAQMQLENALMEGYQNQAPVSGLAEEIRALSKSENAVAGLEAFDRYGLLKLISPALMGPALNTAGLGRLERLAHTVLPAEMTGGWLAFLTVLTEKLTAKDRAALLRCLNLPPGEAEQLAKLEAQAKKLEAAVKSPRITRPSHVYEALHRASADEVLMVLYESGQRIVQDRIRAYFSKYLPLSQEITEEQVAATGVKPGTPKFEKALQTMIGAHLNARPKKIPEPEAEVAAAAPPGAPMVVPRGARK